MKRSLHLCLMVVALAFCSVAAVPAALAEEEAAVADDAVVAALIKQLGAAEYRAREEAESQLRTFGRQIKAVLENVTDADDPEVKIRVRRLLKRINKPNMFVGVWHSSQFGGLITLNADGTWKGGIHSGRWFIRGDSIVWTYHDEGNKREDENPILTRNPNRFTIRERDSAITTFSRR